MDDTNDDNGLYEDLERRALFGMPDEEDEERAPDLIRSLSGEPELSRDLTLGGYIDEHSRVPAFEGTDGQPYTVDVDVEENEHAERRFAAFFIFIRWAATGAGIMDHLESGDVAWGETEEAARQAALELSLYEVRAELDAAIARRGAALEG